MKKHQQTFISLGIALEQLENPNWGYLLDHGEFYDYHWKLEDLTKDQMKQLLSLLEEYGETGWYGLYGDLKRQLAR